MPRWRRYLENPVAENTEWTTHFEIVFRWTPAVLLDFSL